MAEVMLMKNPAHAGEVLRELVLVPLNMEVTEAASRLGVARTTLSRVLNGRAGISAELAVRLEMAGCSTAKFWLRLQVNYELSLVKASGLTVRPLQQAPIEALLHAESADCL